MFGVITVIQRVAPTYAKPITVVLTLTFTILAFPIMRFHHYSTVILRNSWEQAERREDRREKFLIGGVNAVIGFLLGVVLTMLKHKFWP